jgi:hypothetical protein
MKYEDEIGNSILEANPFYFEKVKRRDTNKIVRIITIIIITLINLQRFIERIKLLEYIQKCKYFRKNRVKFNIS